VGAWGALIMSFFGAVFASLTLYWHMDLSGIALVVPFARDISTHAGLEPFLWVATDLGGGKAECLLLGEDNKEAATHIGEYPLTSGLGLCDLLRCLFDRLLSYSYPRLEKTFCSISIKAEIIDR